MLPDTSSVFGHYRPDSLVRRMISLSQRAPANLFGRQLAKLLRKIVRAQVQPPLDVEVGELRLRCYLWDNYTERKLVFMPWRFDVRERKKLFSVLPADGVFVDIGANIGVYALFAATRMNSKGRVVALEPYPPVHDRLCFNLQATRHGRSEWPEFTVLPIGVADKVMEFTLHLNPENLGENSIVTDVGAGNSGETLSVQCKPLLDILTELSINHIDVLKIDIEGAEDMALCPFFCQCPRFITAQISADRKFGEALEAGSGLSHQGAWLSGRAADPHEHHLLLGKRSLNSFVQNFRMLRTPTSCKMRPHRITDPDQGPETDGPLTRSPQAPAGTRSGRNSF